ncbi:MAG: DUF5050 domain-containing protein [Lachnospiraceae bacterium]|nr:DUF5050 domain-containing protein [Lachnospiraceae bacterium]
MKKALKTILVIIIIVAIIGLLVLVRILGDRSVLIPENDPTTIGNTPGNLYNGGTFCEADGKVYFSNPYDGGTIYVMNSDQTDIRKLVSGSDSFINAAGGYIYYFSTSASDQSGLGYVRNGRGIYRVDAAGKTNVLLARVTTDSCMLFGSRVYYTNFGENPANEDVALVTVDSVSINGKDNTTHTKDHPKLGCAADGMIYYAGMEKDHHLYAMSPEGRDPVEVCSLNMYLPIVSGDNVFFLDMDDQLRLKCYSLTNDSVRTISNETIDSYNLYGDIIYYQTVDMTGGSDYALKRIRVDGSGEEVVRPGTAAGIQITSDYVYFHDFANDMPIYQTPTFGSVNVTTFSGASTAVKIE